MPKETKIATKYSTPPTPRRPFPFFVTLDPQPLPKGPKRGPNKHKGSIEDTDLLNTLKLNAAKYRDWLNKSENRSRKLQVLAIDEAQRHWREATLQNRKKFVEIRGERGPPRKRRVFCPSNFAKELKKLDERVYPEQDDVGRRVMYMPPVDGIGVWRYATIEAVAKHTSDSLWILVLRPREDFLDKRVSNPYLAIDRRFVLLVDSCPTEE